MGYRIGQFSQWKLEIAAGGYQGEFELGGIPLLDLRIAEGAANTDVSFSEVNPVKWIRCAMIREHRRLPSLVWQMLISENGFQERGW